MNSVIIKDAPRLACPEEEETEEVGMPAAARDVRYGQKPNRDDTIWNQDKG